ncbi:MAG TPA: CRTAC1 family protein [Bacteroidales bacterium]|nr:CRTAC1 family protein [Bacteroidales bacterium]
MANKRFYIKPIVTFIFIAALASPFFIQQFSSGRYTLEPQFDTTSALNRFGFYLNEVSERSGISFVHHAAYLDPLIDPIMPQISSMGASVSVCDFDNDGWNDIYVTNSRFGGKNCLFHNLRDGTFENVAEKTGLADLNIEGLGCSMGSVWADYDNDGFEDVFIYRYGKPELFKNEGGKSFTRVTEKSGLPGWINANSAIWLDYDSDGLIDLFIGGYFPEDVDLWHLKSTRILTESFEYAQNGGRNYLFRNMGDGSFTDVTYDLGLTTTRWTLAAGSADINRDGYPELVIANDYGIDEFYLNEGGKKLTEISNSTMIGFAPKSGMNVSFGDVSNKGLFGIYISNITEEGILIQGNNFWMPVNRDGKVVYENSARRLGIESGGWCYSAQFGDLNNDGYLDLYVANGYISGKKGTDYWYDFAKVTGGNEAIISDIKNWPAMEGRSHSGYQQNKIWINENATFFTDAANLVSDKEFYDSRAVALADLWNRGTLDIIVANQNDRLLVYKNMPDKDNNWISLELKGTSSNRSAINTLVDIYWNNQVQSQVVTGGIGFCSQNQRRLHFGLGQATGIDSVIVSWPGGKKQLIYNPPINRILKITEKS